MHIVKAETKHFNDYRVFRVIAVSKHPEKWWEPIYWSLFPNKWPDVDKEIEVSHVIEADDATGLLITQLTDDAGDLLFSNGHEDIALDNTARLLLLLPNIRGAFHNSGFRPKLVTHYEERIRISYNGPQQILPNQEVMVPAELVDA